MAMNTSSQEWRRLRSRLHHDWLSGRYVPAAEGLKQMIARGDEGGVWIEERAKWLQQEWETHQTEIRRLLDGFPQAMTPAALVDDGRFAFLPSSVRSAFRDLIDSLWRARYPVIAWVNELESALEDAEKAHAAFRKLLIESGDELAGALLTEPFILEGVARTARRVCAAVAAMPPVVLVC